MMNERALYWPTFVAAALSLLLFIVSMSLANGNRNVQEQIAQRQSVINVARNVMPLNQQLSQALYDASVKEKDKALEDLLVSQGVRLPEPAKSDEKK
ncbi:MAG: hypothetical protein AB7S81_06135 [Bdellovibrionales bacterium]